MRFTNLRLFILFAAAAGLAFAAVSGSTNHVAGQAQDQDEIEYGIVYDCGAGKGSFKVIECDGDDDSDWCKVQYLNKFSPGGIGAEVKRYRELIKADIAAGCKPKQDAKKKEGARRQAKSEPESEPEEKPTPKKPAAIPASKPKPTPEPEPEPAYKQEQQKEDESPDEPVSTAPQFQLGDCVKVGSSQGIITRTDGEAFYVLTADGTTRVPLSSVSTLKKATGCGG